MEDNGVVMERVSQVLKRKYIREVGLPEDLYNLEI